MIESCHARFAGVSLPSVRRLDRKSTRLNSSHSQISYAVFCLKKKILVRGVPERLLAEPAEYRFDASRLGAELTGPYYIDRLYPAGSHIRMRKHLGLKCLMSM